MYKKYHVYISFLCMGLGATQTYTSLEAWTWLYAKKFSAEEQGKNRDRQEVHFTHSDLPEFTQLVFSWNGFRCCTGYFSFWVQARDQQTRQWSNWHKMIEWGNTTQRSYLSTQDQMTSYHHVRLEMNAGHAGDAFRIRVMAHDNADLSLIKALTVSLSHLGKFQPEDIGTTITSLPSVHIKNVPCKSQIILQHEDNRKMCSPTSCSMLIGYLMGSVIDPIDFALQAYDRGLEAYGSWPFNMAHAFERCNGQIGFAIARLASFGALHKHLQDGVPVVVSVRGELEGAPKKYESGHLLVVVGWNARKKRVICHDPALDEDKKTVKHYPLESFLRAWERSHRLAYVASPGAFVMVD